MITREKIIQILQSHSYNVEDQAGNHLVVVDDDSWDAVATEVKNCSMSGVVGLGEQLPRSSSYEPCEGCGLSCPNWMPFFCNKK